MRVPLAQALVTEIDLVEFQVHGRHPVERSGGKHGRKPRGRDWISRGGEEMFVNKSNVYLWLQRD